MNRNPVNSNRPSDAVSSPSEKQSNFTSCKGFTEGFTAPGRSRSFSSCLEHDSSHRASIAEKGELEPYLELHKRLQRNSTS